MFGVYIFAGAAGSSMSLLVLVITGLRNAGYLKNVVTLEHYHIMGKWMFAFCVFWAYIGFGQYMLIWYANMPEETRYFLVRNTESWWYLEHVAGDRPFLRTVCDPAFAIDQKTSSSALLRRGWILFMQLLDMYIVVLPALHGTGIHVSMWDFVALIAMGSTLAFAFCALSAKLRSFRCAIRG